MQVCVSVNGGVCASCPAPVSLQRAERAGQEGPAYIKTTVSPAPRGLPVFGSSGKLGMQDFGMESAAHLRQVCLLVFINIFFFLLASIRKLCSFHFSWGGRPSPLLSLTLSLSLSLCSQGKTDKPCSFPSMRRSHVSSVHDRRPWPHG